MSDVLPALKAQQHNIARQLLGFITITIILFTVMTVFLLVPAINTTFDDLQEDKDRDAVRIYAAKLNSYLENRRLALVDIAANPKIINDVLLGRASPTFRDYLSHLQLLGEDPTVTVLDIMGSIIYTESQARADYAWVDPILAAKDAYIINVVSSDDVKQFELAVPIYYGAGVEGVLVAKFNASPLTIFEHENDPNRHSAVRYEKDGVIIESSQQFISQPHSERSVIEGYNIILTHISDHRPVSRKKQELVWRYVTSILVGALFLMLMMILIGRKIIVKPYAKLAEAEAELIDAHSFQKLILDSNPDLFFVKDEQFRIVDANQAFIELYPKEQQDKIIGYTTVEEYPKDQADVFLENDKVAFKDGYHAANEVITFPNGSVKTLYTQKIRFENSHGDRFILGTSRDVTEREKLLADLQASNKELDDFAYIASHDLKEPLRGIQNHSDSLLKNYADTLDEDGVRKLNRVIFLSSYMGQLIADLLYYSRLGRIDEALQETNMHALVETTREALLASFDETIEIHIDNKLPMVTCEKQHIRELFHNLMSNGLKYNTSSPKVLHVGTIQDHAMRELIFYVKDNGIGIDPKHHESIFKIFKRLHKKDAYGGGTGSGLTFVKKIVDKHKGRIWVESQPNGGSAFYFTLKPKGKTS